MKLTRKQLRKLILEEISVDAVKNLTTYDPGDDDAYLSAAQIPSVKDVLIDIVERLEALESKFNQS